MPLYRALRRTDLAASDPPGAARLLLGRLLRVTKADGEVTLRIVEVEAYGGPPDGPWPDPAAHGFRGRSRANATMFGPAGHLYVYRSYGIHRCANITCGPDGTAGGVLLRGADVVEGAAVAAVRRHGSVLLARGPGNLGEAAGIVAEDDGLDLFAGAGPVRLEGPGHDGAVAWGPRTGVSREADRPWRAWIPGGGGVSVYRRHPKAPVN